MMLSSRKIPVICDSITRKCVSINSHEARRDSVTLDDQPLKLGSNAKKFWQISHDWAPKAVVTNFDGRDLSDGVTSVAT